VEARAAATRGGSDDAIHAAVRRVIEARAPGGGAAGRLLVDVGCGTARLRERLAGLFGRYVGADVIRHDGFPADAEFARVDLDTGRLPIPDGSADIVTAVETIEHLENPRAFMRELVRLARPGGLVVVTTPNQLSWLSLLTLLTKGVFNAFQEGPGLYPAHLTALLETDLLRIGRECGLADLRISFTDRGRIPFCNRHWPARLGLRGRRFSDNILMSGVRPG
jgi:SAM-dependent methyltransferase